MKKPSVIQVIIMSLIGVALFFFIMFNIIGLVSMSYLMVFVILFVISPIILLTYAIAKYLPKKSQQKQISKVENVVENKREPTKFAASGSGLVDRMEELVQTPFTCPKCKKTFSIEEGIIFAKKRGIRENVIMCAGCHSTYNLNEVLPSMWKIT